MHLKELDANLLVVLDELLVDASVTKAAERLGRSPSAVSHALANLREIFQDELFVRAGQHLVLTAKAEELAPTVHVICAGIRSLLRRKVPFDPSSMERNFVFACSEACELAILGKLRQKVQREAPGISLEWHPYMGESSLDDLRLNEVQFVISERTPDEDAADFVWKYLNEENYVTVCSAKHPLAGKKIGKRKFSEQEHILVSSQENGINRVQEHYESHELELDIRLRVPSVFTALLYVLDSYALVTIPNSIFGAIKEKLDISQIRQPLPQLCVQTYLGWHRSQDRDECHGWIRSHLFRNPDVSGLEDRKELAVLG